MSHDLEPSIPNSTDIEKMRAAIDLQPYPQSLRPDHQQSLELDGVTYSVPGTTLIFDRRTGPSIESTFGGKGLIDFEGGPMFAELVVHRMALADGWSGRWIETYAAGRMKPRFITDWIGNASIGGQGRVPIGDDQVENVLERITVQNGNSFKGCWDVMVGGKLESSSLNSNGQNMTASERLRALGCEPVWKQASRSIISLWCSGTTTDRIHCT